MTFTSFQPSLWSSLVPQSICLPYRRSRFNPRVRKIPWRRAWQPTPVLLPGESHGQTVRGIFPDQGSNPWSPALAGRFLTTGPPAKSQASFNTNKRARIQILPPKIDGLSPHFANQVTGIIRFLFLCPAILSKKRISQ